MSLTSTKCLLRTSRAFFGYSFGGRKPKGYLLKGEAERWWFVMIMIALTVAPAALAGAIFGVANCSCTVVLFHIAK